MQADCTFCQIVRKEKNCDLVFENDAFMIFLDIKPLFPGHCLVIPKLHLPTLPDLSDDLIARLFVLTKQASQAVEEATHAMGTFIAINNKVSQSVPHLHVHIVPRRRGDGLRGFFWPRHSYQNDVEKEHIRVHIANKLKYTHGD